MRPFLLPPFPSPGGFFPRGFFFLPLNRFKRIEPFPPAAILLPPRPSALELPFVFFLAVRYFVNDASCLETSKWRGSANFRTAARRSVNTVQAPRIYDFLRLAGTRNGFSRYAPSFSFSLSRPLVLVLPRRASGKMKNKEKKGKKNKNLI